MSSSKSICTNPAGATQRPGQNPAAVTLRGVTAVPASDIKNGNVTLTTTTSAPVSPIPGAPGCPNARWTETITDVAVHLGDHPADSAGLGRRDGELHLLTAYVEWHCHQLHLHLLGKRRVHRLGGTHGCPPSLFRLRLSNETRCERVTAFVWIVVNRSVDANRRLFFLVFAGSSG